MPDLQNFAVTPAAGGQVTMPSWTISFQVCDSKTGAVLADHTGGNALTFPGSFIAGSVQVQNALIQKWTLELIQAILPSLWL